VSEELARIRRKLDELRREVATVSGGSTDLSYTAATRVLASSTGADATIPLVSTGDAGLAPASGGGTTNFLRADGTWATPAYPTPLTHQQIQSRISIRF
jgi:hypothetical protein